MADNVKMCSHCGEYEAVTLKLSKQDPDLDGMGVGWSETEDVLEDNDVGDDKDFYIIKNFCSGSCIHLAGEFKHGMASDD